MKHQSHLLKILVTVLAAITFSCQSPQGDANSGTNQDALQLKSDLLEDTYIAVAYSGFRTGQHPDRGNGAVTPTDKQIIEDLEILLKDDNFKMIRLYDSKKNSKDVLRIIDSLNLDMKVLLGIWLDAEISNHEGCPWLNEPIPAETLAANKIKNLKELDEGIMLANKYKDIIFSINVGNECQVEWNDHMVEEDTLIKYIKYVKENIEQPVTTADNYDWWAKQGKGVAEVVDYIGVHTYPLWEGYGIDTAIHITEQNIKVVMDSLPGKPIVITEAGWTTVAVDIGEQANEDNQVIYVNQLIDWAKANNVTTFLFEAFDEDWKGDPNRMDGAEKHWGLFTVDRKAKKVMYDKYPELMPDSIQ